MMHHHPCSHMGVCSCGLFHNQSSNSFSMIFSSYDDADAVPVAGSTSSVDCTLSLATPSTRLSDDDDRRRRSYVPNFCWDMLQCGQNVNAVPTSAAGQPSRTGARPAANGGDPLLARRCANCDTTSTPLWRNGPRGPKSLCNACGIRFKKEERRANANSGGSGTAGYTTALMEQQTADGAYSSWVQPQKMQCYSPADEFRFTEDNDGADGIPFLSWRVNMTDRPTSLVHDFTR